MFLLKMNFLHTVIHGVVVASLKWIRTFPKVSFFNSGKMNFSRINSFKFKHIIKK